MKRRRHNQKSALTSGGHATAVAEVPPGKTRCDICAHVVSVTKAGIRRKHKIRSSECPGSGMRA